MSDASPHGGNAGLDFLRAVIAADGARAEAPSLAALSAMRELVAAWRAPAEIPADLHGRACPLPAAEWHLQALLDLADNTAPDAAVTAKRRYHARWLGHLLMPGLPEFRPVVTIIIPTYNRAALTAEAVETCVAQTWRPYEILVVDDGSTDDLAGALAPFGDAVRILRKPNGGVSSARNAGTKAALGDLIHFLDSDNLLMPESVARKVEAFAHIPDAELCYNHAEVRGDVEPQRIKPLDGLEPTYRILGLDTRSGLYVSCTMLPRFTLLATGGFDEDLPRTEDTRYWFRLAMRGTKAIWIDAKLAVRRVGPTGLSQAPKPRPLILLTAARTLPDCLAEAQYWPLAARSFIRVAATILDPHGPSPLTPATERETAKVIAALPTVTHRDGHSPLPLLAQCRHVTELGLKRAGAIDQRRIAIGRQMRQVLDAAIAAAPPLTATDPDLWSNVKITGSRNGRLNAFCEHAGKVLAGDPGALPLIDELLRHARTIPLRRSIRRYIRRRRLMVPRALALWLAHTRHAAGDRT